LDVYLMDRRGTEFWIRQGAVRRFGAPHSLAQNPFVFPDILPEPKIAKDEILRLATNAVLKLAKNAKEINEIDPVMRQARDSNGRLLPVFYVSWLSRNIDEQYKAMVEVDACSGSITFIDLRGRMFADTNVMHDIQTKVLLADSVTGTPSPATPSPVQKRVPRSLPVPTMEDAQRGLASWLWLCSQLDIEPGRDTGLGDVDWDRSAVYTNTLIGPNVPISMVVLKSGASFEVIGGTAFGCYAPDACFVGAWRDKPPEYFNKFIGTASLKWKSLAGDLQDRISKRLGVPERLLLPLRPSPTRRPPEEGSESVARVVVDWRAWPKREGFVQNDEAKLAFEAEFDLTAGKTKWVRFYDPRIVAAINDAQRKLSTNDLPVK
jgi:hypothetical protein